jgi:hypothetical protein
MLAETAERLIDKAFGTISRIAARLTHSNQRAIPNL